MRRSQYTFYRAVAERHDRDQYFQDLHLILRLEERQDCRQVEWSPPSAVDEAE